MELSGLKLLSASMKTAGLFMVIFDLKAGVILMVLAWYVLDFHYYRQEKLKRAGQ